MNRIMSAFVRSGVVAGLAYLLDPDQGKRRRGGFLGKFLGALGLGVALRGLTNREMKQLVGWGDGKAAVNVHKTINIEAPVEEIYEFWSNFKNFPRFMEHVSEVRDLGGGRSLWTVKGPAGIPVEWEAVVTRQIPNEELAWESTPRSESGVKTSGVVRFEPSNGRTRIDIRMNYTPPAGELGHAVASLLGANPRQAMNEDLMRFKSLMEECKATVHGEEVTASPRA